MEDKVGIHDQGVKYKRLIAKVEISFERKGYVL